MSKNPEKLNDQGIDLIHERTKALLRAFLSQTKTGTGKSLRQPSESLFGALKDYQPLFSNNEEGSLLQFLKHNSMETDLENDILKFCNAWDRNEF